MKYLLFTIAIMAAAGTVSAQVFTYKKKLLPDSINIKGNYHLQQVMQPKQTAANTDSVLSSTERGFDIKQSRVDNMFYANTNNNNAATNSTAGKSSVAESPKPDDNMPVKKFEIKKFPEIKDTMIRLNYPREKLLPKH